MLNTQLTKIIATVNSIDGSIISSLNEGREKQSGTELLMNTALVNDFKLFSKYDTNTGHDLFIDSSFWKIENGLVSFDFSELKAELEADEGEF